MTARTGIVYLLHFDRLYVPYPGAPLRACAGHYIGWTCNLTKRLARHRNGQGARLIAVITQAGIGFTLARTWPGGRDRERQIKAQGGASRCCPLCGVTPRTHFADLPLNRDGSLSRSRTTDSQKERAGVMTSAQYAAHGTAAQTKRLPGRTSDTRAAYRRNPLDHTRTRRWDLMPRRNRNARVIRCAEMCAGCRVNTATYGAYCAVCKIRIVLDARRVTLKRR